MPNVAENTAAAAAAEAAKKPSKLSELFARLGNNVWKPGMGYVKNHPGMTTGLGLLGGLNIAGLFDNNQLGGQALGLLGGAGVGKLLLPRLLENVSPQAKILSTLAGGSLGALFDVLMNAREKQNDQDLLQQAQYANQYQGRY